VEPGAAPVCISGWFAAAARLLAGLTPPW